MLPVTHSGSRLCHQHSVNSTELLSGELGLPELLLGVGRFHRNGAGKETGLSSSARRTLAQLPPGLRFLSYGQVEGFPSLSVPLLRGGAGHMCVKHLEHTQSHTWDVGVLQVQAGGQHNQSR